ncbi:MAG TPA: hypothetical protein VD713_03325 [Sphingomonadales bacterium]|nr:hypothetical protein [Sphingomonadales bacterium]
MVGEPLQRDGFIFLRHALSSSLLESAKRDLYPYLKGLVNDEGSSLQHIGGILSLSPTCRLLAANPVVLAVIARHLETPSTKVHVWADFFLWAPAAYDGGGALRSFSGLGVAGNLAPSVSAIWPLKNFLRKDTLLKAGNGANGQHLSAIREKPEQGDVLLVSKTPPHGHDLASQNWLRAGLVFEYGPPRARIVVGARPSFEKKRQKNGMV